MKKSKCLSADYDSDELIEYFSQQFSSINEGITNELLITDSFGFVQETLDLNDSTQAQNNNDNDDDDNTQLPLTKS